jgi:small-conductance mechanosensitive channel/CRP-like cAMP-binding protein
MPPTWVWILLGGVTAFVAANFGVRVADRGSKVFAGPLRALRNLLIPTALAYALIRTATDLPDDATTVRLLGTAFGVSAIWVSLSLLRALALGVLVEERMRARVPTLFVDLIRVLLVVLGSVFVVAGVWGTDLSGLLATLGVGSLVVGLALQDTLGNLFAGLALMSERSVAVGDWIKVGDLYGEVVEITWRSVRLKTREHDMVVVPNSTLGKENIYNYSRPTRIHEANNVIGFSYDDPPNKVKRILTQVAASTRGVLAKPAPNVRTIRYADSAIDYEIEYCVDDFGRLEDIENELMTQVWYAAMRNGLTIPFPIRTVYKTEVPPPKRQDAAQKTKDAFTQIPVFVPLTPEELDALSHDAVIQTFAAGEHVVHQGDPGDALYVIRSGTALVRVRTPDGADREVARLARGEFFGEMALLTGEPRSATVVAIEDLETLVVFKEAMQGLMQRRPELAQEIAETVEVRRHGLRSVQEMRDAPAAEQAAVRDRAGQLVSRIKRFLGL